MGSRKTDVGIVAADRICQHEHRIHPLGAGMFVCFACWVRLLLGGTR